MNGILGERESRVFNLLPQASSEKVVGLDVRSFICTVGKVVQLADAHFGFHPLYIANWPSPTTRTLSVDCSLEAMTRTATCIDRPLMNHYS